MTVFDYTYCIALIQLQNLSEIKASVSIIKYLLTEEKAFVSGGTVGI